MQANPPGDRAYDRSDSLDTEPGRTVSESVIRERTTSNPATPQRREGQLDAALHQSTQVGYQDMRPGFESLCRWSEAAPRFRGVRHHQ